MATAERRIPIRHAHILKPQIERFEGVVFNEELCMKLSAAVGIPTADIRTGRVEGIHYVLVERYDRTQVPATSGGKPGYQ